VGGNPVAARLAGIGVDRIKILGFIISGVCAALTGTLLASRLGSGTTSAADSYLLTAFAAVFLGSATLRDGEFHVLGTFIGTLIIVFGFNGLNIFGAPTFSQYVFQGAILIVALRSRVSVGCWRKAEERAMDGAAVWRVYVMEYARSKDQPWVDLISGMYREGTMDLPFSFILAQRGDRNVLVDTGFMQEEHRSGFSRKFGIPTWISPVRLLREANLAPDAITDIVLTHCHFDHMGSIAEFPNAHIYVQKTELLSWYEAFALPRRFAHLTAIVDPDNIRSALDASIAHRVTLIDGDKNNVLPGIHVRLGSGHTIGQQFVIIETEAGRRVISGDCVYSRRQFAGHNNDGVYVPLNNAVGSVWEQLKTIDKMNDELGGDLSRLVVLHDIERWKGHKVVKEVDGFRIVEIG
jgi:glyoxylase-like metal-dependent hydrolase (beta-lactamase superfamily II)